MVTRSKDIRQMVVYGYARLVGYDENYEFVPDLLESYENEDNRKFTLRLRKGTNGRMARPLRRKISDIGGKTSPTTNCSAPLARLIS